MYKKIIDENNNEIIEMFEVKEVISERFNPQSLLIEKVRYENKIFEINQKIEKIINDTDYSEKYFLDLYEKIKTEKLNI